MNEQIRAEFEQDFPLPEGFEFNSRLNIYMASVYSKPSVGDYNNKWRGYQYAHARHAGSGEAVRQQAADAITGALMFGAQGNNRPPKGHWLMPFWEMGNAQPERKCSECGDGREGLTLCCMNCLGNDGWSHSAHPVVAAPPAQPRVLDRAALIESLTATSKQSEGVTADLIIAMLSAQENSK